MTFPLAQMDTETDQYYKNRIYANALSWLAQIEEAEVHPMGHVRDIWNQNQRVLNLLDQDISEEIYDLRTGAAASSRGDAGVCARTFLDLLYAEQRRRADARK